MAHQKLYYFVKIVLVICGFTFLFTEAVSFAQGAEGYWRFTELKTRGLENDVREGAQRSYMSGGPGSAAFNTETDWSDIMLVFRANGVYTEPPQVMIPGSITELPYSITRTQYRRPDWHWNPGARISIHDTRPDRDPDRRPFGENYGALAVSGIGDTDPKSDVAIIDPPVYHGDDEAYYVITFFIGSSSAFRYFDYLYEWVPGMPTQEELAESVVKGTSEPILDSQDDEDLEIDGSLSLITYKRGDVQARIDHRWQSVTTGTYLPEGSQIRTGPNGVAEITLPGGILVRMRPGSTLDIPVQLETDQRNPLQQLLGRLWIRAVQGAAWNVETSSAIAGVRGTEFGVEVDESGRETFISYSGEIEVTPFDKSGNPAPVRAMILSRGEKVVVNPAGDWTAKTLIDETEQSVGIILGRSGFSDSTILPQESGGRLFTDRELGDWRLQIYEQSHGAKHGLLFFEGLIVRDVDGSRLASPFGILRYYGHFDENSNSGWLITDEVSKVEETNKQPLTGEDLGYTIVVPEGQRNEVHILRNGDLAWSLSQFMVFPEFEMIDETGNGIPNLLVRYARGRSFRGFIFLELGPEEVRELWGFQVHASGAYEIEDDIERRRQQGESLERSPQRGLYPRIEDNQETVPADLVQNEHITLTSHSFRSGESIDVRWHNLPGNNTDWISVAPAGATDRTWGIHWWYIGGDTSGSNTIELVEPGEYEIRVYYNWPAGDYQVQSRLSFQVLQPGIR
ncbi:MAG: hypothetical protein EA391_00840 [Balneolaceae bacterium]|nr:MAG: hypothetical protein EA391_00840 [Balneolaceae bacterium]